MWPFVKDLLQRSAQEALANGSSTTISVWWLGFGVIILGFLFTLGTEWLTGGRNMAALFLALKSWKSWLGGLLALVVAWACLFLYSVFGVVYQDHQKLLTAEAKTCPICTTRETASATKTVPITTPHVSVKIKQGNSGTANPGIISGRITQGPCGVVQNGGSGNFASPNCTPPERKLSKFEQDQIFEGLHISCPFPIAVRPVTGNAESMKYADQIVAALKVAGCNPQPPRFLIDTAASYGIQIVIHDPASGPLAADAVVRAFKAANIPVTATSMDMIEPGVVYIMVGLLSSKQPE
jgi:hypothetical protein